MNPTQLKDIAKVFIEKHYSMYSAEVEEIWETLEEADIDITSAAKGSRLAEGLGFGKEADAEFREMISRIAIFFFTYQETKDKDDITKPELFDRVKKICTLLKINGDFEKKAEGIIELVLSSTAAATPKTVKGYRVWYPHSEPEGEPITSKGKEALVADILKKDKTYDLFILKEETFTHFFINGKKTKAPGKLCVKILLYVLKHKGTGGTAWNIAKNIWDIDDTEKIRDLKEIARAVKEQPRIELGKAQEKAGDTKKFVAGYSKLTRRRIADLNKNFLKKVNTKFRAANEMDEYELTPSVKYCLLQKESDF